MSIQSILATARVIQEIDFIEPETLTFKAGHTGTMIALFPSLQMAKMLSRFGTEEAKELHITLAFLGETSEIQDTSMLLDVMSVLAKDYLPMSGKINGVGRFNMFDPQKQDVFITLPDIPALPLFRQNTFEFIKMLGYNPKQDHGFIPHITLSYLQDNESIPTEMIPPFQLQFNNVSVVLSEDRYDFPFGDGSMATRAGARNSQIDLKRIQDTHDLCVDLGAVCRAEYENKAFVEKKGTRSSGNWGHGGRPGKKGGSGKGGGFGRLGFEKGSKPNASEVRAKAKKRGSGGAGKEKKDDKPKGNGGIGGIKAKDQADFSNQLMTKVQNGEIDFAEAQRLQKEFAKTQPPKAQKVDIGDIQDAKRFTRKELLEEADIKPWQKWGDDLSDGEKEALRLYQSGPDSGEATDFTKINNNLRGKDKNPSDATTSTINELDSALNKGRVSEDMVVFRGFPPGIVDNLKPGDTFTDSAFTSTSTSFQTSRDFGRNVAEIRVSRGARGGYMDAVSPDTGPRGRQHELVLPRGTTFKVVGRGEQGPIMEVQSG